ncbi:cell wall protein Ecm33 [Dimargaris verticillata]|uniref:Cell wall protein Ecm33 n=1 Tax=Dimargaris verticillata TaxID=2761393 RepID=A0A9W8B5I2_9FUNG|nr:cell wall protein Ecm33 [Dimargaris verticillata]
MKAGYAFYLAVAAAALSGAQGDSGCSGNVATDSQDDVNQIAGCSSYSGNVEIAESHLPTLVFGNLKSFDGDLLIKNNAQLATVEFPKLQKFSGRLTFQNNTRLHSINVDQLTEVNAFHAIVNPSLSALSFPKGLDNMDTFQILDSSIAKLDGLAFSKINNFDLYANHNLTDIALKSLTQVGGYISIVNNNENAAVSLPKLKSIAQNATFANLQDLDLSGLESVDSDLSFHDNGFKNFTVKNLAKIKQSLSINNNGDLESFSFDALEDIGGNLLVVNNTEIASFDGFPALVQVKGSIDIRGSFKEAKFDSLKKVEGGFTVRSTESVDCKSLQGAYGKGTTAGKWDCKEKTDESEVTSSNTTKGSGSNSAAPAMGPSSWTSAFVGGLSLVVAGLHSYL